MHNYFRRLKVYAFQAVVIIFSLLFIEYTVRQGIISPLYLAAPSQIAVIVPVLLNNYNFLSSLWVSTLRAIASTILTLVVGVGLGILLGSIKYLHDVLNPYITALYTIPKIVLLPLFMFMLGLGESLNIIFGFFHGIFPMIIYVASSVKMVTPDMIMVARSMGASTKQVYSKVVLPAIVPSLLSALRISIILIFTGILIVEMWARIGEMSGVGWLVYDLSMAAFRTGEPYYTANMYAIVVIFSLLAISINQSILFFEKRLSRRRLVKA